IPLSRVDLGACPQGTDDPLQAICAGVPVGAAEPGVAHAGADSGLLDDHAFRHTALRHFSAKCPVALDILLAVAFLRGRVDCWQWRSDQEGQSRQVGVSDGGHRFQPDQPVSVTDSAGPSGSADAPSVLLDLAVLAGPLAGAYDFHSGNDILLRGCECLLPGRCPHSASSAVRLVLRHAHYLFSRLHTTEAPVDL